LAAGTAVLAGRLREALVAESLEAGPVQPPAVRHTASVLHRLAGLLGTGEYEQYTGACARLGAADDQGTSPGVALSRLLRRRHDSGVRLDDTGSAASELRHLVAWSATAPIAFGNLLGASGNTTATEDGRP
jgi:hypothetical protein